MASRKGSKHVRFLDGLKREHDPMLELRERAAKALGETLQATMSMSLPTLGQLLRSRGDTGLADEISQAVRSGEIIRGARPDPGRQKVRGTVHPSLLFNTPTGAPSDADIARAEERHQQAQLRNMSELLQNAGFNPADAGRLIAEGMGTEELRGRLRIPATEVGGLTYTHGLNKVSGAEATRSFPLVDRPIHERPMAVAGLTSYRYRGNYGWIMIGAKNDTEALKEARRSTGVPTTWRRLERWSGDKYEPVKGE